MKIKKHVYRKQGDLEPPEPILTFDGIDIPSKSKKEVVIKHKQSPRDTHQFAINMESEVIKNTKGFLPKHDSPLYQFTDKVLEELAICAVKDHSIQFSCLKAGITTTEYKVVLANNPTIREFLLSLRDIPDAIAQEGIIEDIKTDKQSRQWYAETRMSDKYSKKQTVEHTVNMSSLLDQMEQGNVTVTNDKEEVIEGQIV
jgi:hypothetical protein